MTRSVPLDKVARETPRLMRSEQAEQDRLDFQHAGTMILLDGQLAQAPIRSPQRVLDIATVSLN